MTTIDRLRAVVHANPSNWQARLILADALEDSGDYIAANGARWQSWRRKRPMYGVAWYTGGEVKFVWKYARRHAKQHWCLNQSIIRKISGLEPRRRGYIEQHYDTLEAAESALAHALHALGITAGVLTP